MCGIAGVRSFSPEDPIRADQIVQLLLASEHRGRDACGVALQDRATGKIQVFKSDDSASRFVQMKKFEEFLEEHLSIQTATAILHTRASTNSGVGDNGNPRNNDNNHPMWKGLTAVVHNGVIHNHKNLFDKFKYERSCNTDSDILRAILDAKGLEPEGIQELSDCYGGAAIAAISERYPGKLLLARSGSPLVVGALRSQIVFASERGIVHAGFRQHTKMFGIWVRPLHVQAAFTPFPTDTAWLFDEIGLMDPGHWKFNTSSFSQGYTHRQDYNTRSSKPKQEKKEQTTLQDDEIVIKGYRCRNPQCENNKLEFKGFDLTRGNVRKFGLDHLYCPDCKMYLGGKGFYFEKVN